MTTLEDAPNIGSVLAAELRAAGIETVDQLRAVGGIEAWERIRLINPERDCASSLLALVGAVQGRRWMSIEPDERKRMREYAAGRRAQ